MSLKEEYNRRQIEKESQRQKRKAETTRARIFDPNFVIQFLLVLCTGGLILVGFLQKWTLDKTDQTLRDTLASGNTANRAFIFAKGVTIGRNLPASWDFSVPIENSGNTPTKGMESLTISDRGLPTDPEDVFIQTPKSGYDAPNRLVQRWSGSFVAPKAQITLLGSWSGLPEISVAQMAEKRENYYIRGVIHYRDAFAGTPEHITKFCYAVIPYKSGTETRVNYDRCLYWNCADEDCKEDSERYDHDLKAINSQSNKSK